MDERNNYRYHYCTLESFVKIIQSHTVRFSDLNSMNDPNELTFLWENYLERLEAKSIAESNEELREEMTFYKMLYEKQMSTMMFMSFSMSLNSDSPFLWRLYSDSGRGVALGFDDIELDNWRKNIHGSFNGYEIDSDSALYWDISYRDSVGLDEFLDYVIEKNIYNDNPIPGYWDIVTGAPFIKSDAFKLEEESRILFILWPIKGINNSFPHVCDYVPNGNEKERKKIKMEWRKNEYSSYYPFFSIPFEDSMLKTIQLGPYCEYDEKYIRLLLQSCGYTNRIEIVRSKSK